jgi:hypothetical protein
LGDFIPLLGDIAKPNNCFISHGFQFDLGDWQSVEYNIRKIFAGHMLKSMLTISQNQLLKSVWHNNGTHLII